MCLKQISNLLANGVKRGTDLVARYGGEEFVILLPDTTNAAAIKIAGKIKKDIEGLCIPNSTSQCSNIITVSMGVATFNSSTNGSTKDLINEADKALYKAKKLGRNLVISA